MNELHEIFSERVTKDNKLYMIWKSYAKIIELNIQIDDI